MKLPTAAASSPSSEFGSGEAVICAGNEFNRWQQISVFRDQNPDIICVLDGSYHEIERDLDINAFLLRRLTV